MDELGKDDRASVSPIHAPPFKQGVGPQGSLSGSVDVQLICMKRRRMSINHFTMTMKGDEVVMIVGSNILYKGIGA
jgi:hypothetical protein